MGEKLNKDSVVKALLEASFARSVGATSLADVAGVLGIKKASLYNHFESRKDLVDQTTASCKEYIEQISFIPDNISEVAKKYTAESVLRGIVSRYVKMHEKTPLFQIYTFVESQKYFDAEAADIIMRQKEKLVSQCARALTALADQAKVSLTHETIPAAALWFCSGLNDLLSQYLLERKKLVMQNPRAGEGELFDLPAPDEAELEKMNAYVDKFVLLIK